MCVCVCVCACMCVCVLMLCMLNYCVFFCGPMCVLLHVPSHPHLLPPPLQAKYGGDCVCYITEDRPAAELAAALCYTYRRNTRRDLPVHVSDSINYRISGKAKTLVFQRVPRGSKRWGETRQCYSGSDWQCNWLCIACMYCYYNSHFVDYIA